MSGHTIILSRRAAAGGRIFLACTALYYLTRSPALDEWDSVQFALGVGDFNLWRHQPHPPGYPLYIAFGWLAHHLPLPWGRLSVHDALSLGSALGGGLFVAGWFVLMARRFPTAVAAISAVALAGLVDTWMTATKVLTDPLGAGLLTVALVFFDRGRGRRKEEGGRMKDEGGEQKTEEGRWAAWRRFAESARANAVRAQSNDWEVKLFERPGTHVACGALAAAAAAGVRPQNFGVLLLIVVLAILVWTRRGWIGKRAGWGIGLGLFFAGCLTWVVPVLAIQAHTPESDGRWLAYGEQLVAQWRWRLDQPKAFLGAAGGQGQGMLLYRLDHHLLGWFTRGFGFSLKSPWGWAGLLTVVAGWVMYYLVWFRERFPTAVTSNGEGSADKEDAVGRGHFWRLHLPWASAYVLMIFCCLPGDQRYYLPVFPLFIVAAVSGWWLWLRGSWRWMALAVPAAALAATLPLVGPNHKEEPPPVRMLRWLQDHHPAREQAKVWLILRDSRRHAEWYAPGFHIMRAEKLDPANPFVGIEQARAVYTDDPQVLPLWPFAAAAWHRVAHFQRSPLIYRKHNEEDLYQLDTTATAAALGAPTSID